MGFLNLFRGKSKKRAEAHIERSGELTNIALTKSNHRNISAISWDMGYIDEIIEEISKAVEIEPENPEYQYMLACALQARLQGAQAEAKLKEIVEKHPYYAQAKGHLFHRERWFLPFLYPAWDETQQVITESFVPTNMQDCYVTSVRSGIRRIVSFFAVFPLSKVGPLLRTNQRATIRAAFMNTPYCPVVGTYTLIDTNPTEPFTLETILRVDSYRPEWNDCSRSGYWLIRMLAQQEFTYFVIADPYTSKAYYNKKILFDRKTRSILNSVSKKIIDINQTETNDENPFMAAQQYFTDNFSIDNITF